MKNFNVTDFVVLLKKELENFEHYQISYTPTTEKTMDEWVSSFMSFSGYADEEGELEFSNEEYDDETYYGFEPQYEELVTRRKIKSFREDSEW